MEAVIKRYATGGGTTGPEKSWSAVHGDGHLPIHDGIGIAMRDRDAGRNDRRNRPVHVEPRLRKERSFASAHGNVGDRRIAGIVIRVQSEHQAGNSFRSEAHTLSA